MPRGGSGSQIQDVFSGAQGYGLDPAFACQYIYGDTDLAWRELLLASVPGVGAGDYLFDAGNRITLLF